MHPVSMEITASSLPLKHHATSFEQFQYWLARKVVIEKSSFWSAISSIFKRILPYFVEIKGKMEAVSNHLSATNRHADPLSASFVEPLKPTTVSIVSLPVAGPVHTIDSTEPYTISKQDSRYYIVSKEPVADLFSASEEAQKTIFKALWNTHQRLEKEAPAAGYQIHIKGNRSGKTPLSVCLESIGSRPKMMPMNVECSTKPPAIGEKCACVLCRVKNTQADMLPLTKLCESNDCFVVKSLNGRPLVLPNTHALHWFDAPAENLHFSLLQAANKVLLATKKSDEYEIWLHIGRAGGMTVPHLHVHVG